MQKINVKNLDRIQRYYLAEQTLLPKELEMCARYEKVFAIYCNVKDKKQTVAKYLAVLAANGVQLSEVSAYRDLSVAEKLFAPMRQYNKEFLRLVLIESAVKDMKRIESRLHDSKTKSTEDIVQLLTIKDRIEKRICDISGLNKEDPNLPDFSQLKPHEFRIDLPPQIRGLMTRLLQQGVMDLTNVSIDDIDFEELEHEQSEELEE